MALILGAVFMFAGVTTFLRKFASGVAVLLAGVGLPSRFPSYVWSPPSVSR